MGYFYNENTSPNSSIEHGLVVELPDGKLFKLSDPNGRVVEMPNGTVVEMLDGQMVEMSNGQLLSMDDGNLVETRPAHIELDEGQVVGHRILSDEEAARNRRKLNPRAAGAEDNSEKVRMERDREKTALSSQELPDRTKNNQDKALSDKQKELAAQERALQQKQVQIAEQLAELKKEEESMRRMRAQLAEERGQAYRMEQAANKKEREAAKSLEDLALKEAEIREKERDLQRHASTASTMSRGSDSDDDKCAMDNIEAGRIRFSDISLGSMLGSGSFADVYRSEWRMPCAVKKMKGRLSKEQMTEFVREGEMMRALRHPGIVKLLGVCVENGSFYLVQEIVNGFGNLFDFLHKPPCKRLTYWQVLQISLGISDAMAYLHDKSIVHRDLKPQNCLLVNERGKVKLCDFGLARLKRTAFVETVSNTAGTPAYQAPEMLRDEPISEKVDLYGFGIMAWEMYTGNLPWSDKSYHQMIHTVAVRNERPPMPSDMPRDLAQLIERCWHPIPRNRPTFVDLLATFKRLCDSVPCDLPSNSVQLCIPQVMRPIPHPVRQVSPSNPIIKPVSIGIITSKLVEQSRPYQPPSGVPQLSNVNMNIIHPQRMMQQQAPSFPMSAQHFQQQAW